MKILFATPRFSLPPNAQHIFGMTEIVPAAASFNFSKRGCAASRREFSNLRGTNSAN
jgi:hypothetical protein